MKTEYYKPQVSPYQFNRKMPNIQNENHPVQEIIRQNLGTYNLTATFLEDTHTIETLKIPGLAAFLCVLKCGDQVLAEGRSLTVISEVNKWYERSLMYAKGQALTDSVAKGVRTLEMLPLSEVKPKQDAKAVFSNVYKEKDSSGGITEKQKNYLLQLLRSNEASEEEIEEVYTLSKEEAAEKISFLAPSR